MPIFAPWLIPLDTALEFATGEPAVEVPFEAAEEGSDNGEKDGFGGLVLVIVDVVC